MRTPRISLLIGETLALATLIWWLVDGRASSPVVKWEIGDGATNVEPYAAVDAETPIRLDLELPSPAHVYLVSHDLIHGCSALFPSEYLHSDVPANPLPAGRHLLPGQGADLELSWQSGDATSPYSCMLIVSSEEIPGMPEALARFRQIGNAAFPKKKLLGGYAPKAGMDQVPPANELLHAAIKAAYRLVDAHNDGPMILWTGHPGVFLKVLRLQNHGHNLKPATDLREQLNTELAKKLQGLVKPSKPGK